MSTWIFQGHPRRYDLADRRKFREDRVETWLVSRYRDQIMKGDVVYFWRAGEESKRGLYGWGTVEENPAYYEDWGWGVPVRYVKTFPEHISTHELKHDPVLSDHLLFRMPIGTNFSVDAREAKAIEDLIRRTLGDAYVPKTE